MKKLFSFLMCLFLCVGLMGCEESVQELDLKKVYTIDDKFELEFRSMVFANEILPTNISDEYYYWSEDDEDFTIVDAQFYVKNLTDKKIKLKDYIEASLLVDGEKAEFDFCMEINDFTEVDTVNKLEANAKSIIHLMFYVEKDALNEATEKGSNIELTLNEEKYRLPLEEKKAKTKKVKLDDVISTDKMDVKILSASTSFFIPALNMHEDSSYYMSEDPDIEFAGMYVEITNKSNEPINLMKDICVTINIEDTEIPAWNSLLSLNRDDFEDVIEIAAKETRAVLFFGEVNATEEPVKYTMNIIFEGRPYSLTYER